jgi:hypothetical protein
MSDFFHGLNFQPIPVPPSILKIDFSTFDREGRPQNHPNTLKGAANRPNGSKIGPAAKTCHRMNKTLEQ